MDTYGYICTWKNKQVTVNLSGGGTYKAQTIAAQELGVPEKKRHEITVHLAYKNGVPITHTPDM